MSMSGEVDSLRRHSHPMSPIKHMLTAGLTNASSHTHSHTVALPISRLHADSSLFRKPRLSPSRSLLSLALSLFPFTGIFTSNVQFGCGYGFSQLQHFCGWREKRRSLALTSRTTKLNTKHLTNIFGFALVFFLILVETNNCPI